MFDGRIRFLASREAEGNIQAAEPRGGGEEQGRADGDDDISPYSAAE